MDVFVLSWDTENATDIKILELLGPRPESRIRTSSGGYRDSTYTIVASNKFSEATATVTVEVVP